METISVPKLKYQQMTRELRTLRNTQIYKRLLEFEKNIAQGNRYSRKDLGF